MKILKNEKGFTLIELVLIIVILGILGAVATVQFGSIMSDANSAALDASPGSYSAQLALAINSFRTVPTCAQFTTSVFNVAQPSGGKVVHTPGACGGGAMTITMQITPSCVDVWTYSDGTTATPGTFARTSTLRTC